MDDAVALLVARLGEASDLVAPRARRILGDEWRVEATPAAASLAVVFAAWEVRGGAARLGADCARECPHAADDAFSLTWERVWRLLPRAARGEVDIDLTRGRAPDPVDNLHALFRTHLRWVVLDLRVGGPGGAPGVDVADDPPSRARLLTPASWGAGVWVWAAYRHRPGDSLQQWLAGQLAAVWGGLVATVTGTHGGSAESVLRRDFRLLLEARVDFLWGVGRWWDLRCAALVGGQGVSPPHRVPEDLLAAVVGAIEREVVPAAATALSGWQGLARSQRRPLLRLLQAHADGRPYRVMAMLRYFPGKDQEERIAAVGETMEAFGVRTRRVLEEASMDDGDGTEEVHVQARRAVRSGALTPAARAHLASCPTCAQWWQAREDARAWAETAPLPRPSPPPAVVGVWVLVACAAAWAALHAVTPPAVEDAPPVTLASEAVYASLLVKVVPPVGAVAEVPVLGDEATVRITAAPGSTVSVVPGRILLRDDSLASATLHAWAVTDEDSVVPLASTPLEVGPDRVAALPSPLPAVSVGTRALKVVLAVTPASGEVALGTVRWVTPTADLPASAWTRVIEVTPR